MKKLSSILFLLIFTFTSYTVAAAGASAPIEPPNTSDGVYILIDADSGEVLAEHDSDREKMYPASTTKIMTAILAIEMGEMEQKMTASSAAINDIGKDGSNIGIMPGEEMTMEDLLKALLICSANESGNIIAENISSSREEFVALMNKKAAELGAVNTHFANPCGAHDDNHYTTAADLAKISRHAMTLEDFRNIVGMKSYTPNPTNKHTVYKEDGSNGKIGGTIWPPVLYTTHKLMQYDDGKAGFVIDGIKTGYTGPAGSCLVSSATSTDGNGMNLISVVLGMKEGGSQTGIRTLSKELLDYGFKNFEFKTLIDKDVVYRSIAVEDAKDDAPLHLVTEDKVTGLLPIASATEINGIVEEANIIDNISAPINKGDILGYVEFSKDDTSIGKVNLLADRSVEMKTNAVVKSKILDFINTPIMKKVVVPVIIVIIGFIALRLLLKTISRKRRLRRY